MFNPYFAIAGGVALLAAAGGGFLKGEDYAHGQQAIADKAALVHAIADRDAKQKRINELEEAAAQREQSRQTIVREITREIPTIVRDPVYRNQCISDDGVRALDRAVAAANGNDPGAVAEPASPAPANPAHR